MSLRIRRSHSDPTHAPCVGSEKGAILRCFGGVSLLLVLSASSLYSAGKTAAESLLTGVGARPSALGGAYTALANDPFAMAYNPSGLARITRPQISFMYSQWLQDSQEQYIAFGLPVKPGVIGVSFYRMDMGNFTGRDASGRLTNEFTAGDMSLGLSFARQVHSQLLIGGKLSYFMEELAGYKASTYFGDIGLMIAASNKVSFGIAAQNIGRGLRFIEETSPLPLTYAFGTSYLLGGIRLAADYKMRPEEQSNEFALRVEFAPGIGQGTSRPLTLRIGHGGLMQGADAASSMQGFGAGFGLALGNMGLDYAFKPFGVLGGTHRLSITIKL